MAYFRLLRDRQAFRRLWWGDVVSLIGDWFNMIAVYTAVQSLTSSAQALAAVFAAKTVPSFLIAPLAGPIVDRFDRRKILIWMDGLRALAVVLLILSYRGGSLAGLYGALVTMAMASGIAMPARSAVLPMVVRAPELPVANALEGATWAVMLAVGSALGGLATELLGIEAALILDGASYVLSGLLFFGLPPLPPPGGSEANTRLSAGLAYLGANREVLALTALKPLMALAGGAIALIPIFGAALPELPPPVAIGALFLARGAGAFTGSLLRGFVGDRSAAMKRAVLHGFGLYVAGFLVLSGASGIGLTAIGFAVAGVGSGIVWVFSSTLLQEAADHRFHGRVFAVESGAMTLIAATSAWAITAAIDAGLSLAGSARVMAAVMIAPLLLWRVHIGPHRQARAAIV